MSGAQGKAAIICGAIGVIAEINPNALKKRFEQGWVDEISENVEDCIQRIKRARKEGKALALAFLGNVVSLWERLADEEESIVELGSDQTSCHNPFNGGYYPVQLTFEESNKMMKEDPEQFKVLVQESLRRHIAAINKLSQKKALKFWDYGNSFLLECGRAKANVMDESGRRFIYPSYVEDIMGDIFSLGFGPFRWVCTSGDENDLKITDQIAADVIKELTPSASEKSSKYFIYFKYKNYFYFKLIQLF
jgi:urocanate hydratase